MFILTSLGLGLNSRLQIQSTLKWERTVWELITSFLNAATGFGCVSLKIVISWIGMYMFLLRRLI